MGIDCCSATVYPCCMVSFRTIISRWPNAEKFGADIGLKKKHRASHARAMKVRNSVPETYWPKLLGSDQARQIGLTEDDLRAAKQARGAA